MSNAKVPVSDGDPRSGWFKLLIPKMDIVFGSLFWNDQVKFSPLPFVYGKLDPELVAFDVELSVPFLALDRVVMVEIVESKKDDKGEDTEEQVEEQAEEQVEEQIEEEEAKTHFEIKIRPLKMLAMDQENRCFIPTRFVTCILPVDPRHPLVTTLIAITTDIVIPPAGEVGKILDIKGRELDSGQPRE